MLGASLGESLDEDGGLEEEDNGRKDYARTSYLRILVQEEESNNIFRSLLIRRRT